MSEVTLYHKPRCSKSRQTLALLEERGIEPEIIEYLKTPPDAATITGLARPPTRACDELDGIPYHQVAKFQVIAPMHPQRMMIIDTEAAMSLMSRNFPMVLATAVPPKIGPRNSAMATMITA